LKLNLSILSNSNPIKPLSGIRFRKEFDNIDKFRIEYGCRTIANFEFPFKFGRIAVFSNFDFIFLILSSELLYLSHLNLQSELLFLVTLARFKRIRLVYLKY